MTFLGFYLLTHTCVTLFCSYSDLAILIKNLCIPRVPITRQADTIFFACSHYTKLATKWVLTYLGAQQMQVLIVWHTPIRWTGYRDFINIRWTQISVYFVVGSIIEIKCSLKYELTNSTLGESCIPFLVPVIVIGWNVCLFVVFQTFYFTHYIFFNLLYILYSPKKPRMSYIQLYTCHVSKRRLSRFSTLQHW